VCTVEYLIQRQAQIVPRPIYFLGVSECDSGVEQHIFLWGKISFV